MVVAQNFKSSTTITPDASVCLPTQAQRSSTTCSVNRRSAVTVQGARIVFAGDWAGSAMRGLDATGLRSTVGSQAITPSVRPLATGYPNPVSLRAADSPSAPASYDRSGGRV